MITLEGSNLKPHNCGVILPSFSTINEKYSKWFCTTRYRTLLRNRIDKAMTSHMRSFAQELIWSKYCLFFSILFLKYIKNYWGFHVDFHYRYIMRNKMVRFQLFCHCWIPDMIPVFTSNWTVFIIDLWLNHSSGKRISITFEWINVLHPISTFPIREETLIGCKELNSDLSWVIYGCIWNKLRWQKKSLKSCW